MLASASPRRADLMALLGVPFAIVPADIDETPRPGEPPEDLVLRLAIGKAVAVAATSAPGAVIIGADTVVAVGDDIFSKPDGDADARRMLSLLSGRSHRVLTGVAVDCEGEIATAVEETTVTFEHLSDADIDWYLATGDHRGKAGSYGIQGIAGVFITHLAGSYTNVVGLPLSTLRSMLAATGVGRFEPRDG